MNSRIASTLITAFTMAIASTGCAQQKEEDKKPPAAEAPPPTPQAKEEKKAPEPSNPHERSRQARQGDEQRRKPARPMTDSVPFIGVVTRNVTPELGIQLGLDEGSGVLVDDVMPDSPAAKAGIRKFDVITQLNGERINDCEHLAALVRAKNKGDEVTLQVIRRAEKQDIKVAVDEHPMIPGFKMFPGGPLPHERGPLGPWGYRFDRWWQDEPWRERERDRDRQRERDRELTPDMIDDAFQQMQRFVREFQDQQHRLEQQFREYQERFQNQLREYQERNRERTPDAGRKPAPEPPKPDGSTMRRGRDTGRETTEARQQRVEVTIQTPGGGETHVTSSGVVQREDPSGLYRIERDDKGNARFSVRAPDGKEQWWPVTTEEQRKAVPEPFRQKLQELDGVRIQIGPGAIPPAPPVEQEKERPKNEA